jgi:hypothetical protein
MERTATELISISVRPQFIYCSNRGRLLRANLLTGEQSSHYMPAYEFKALCKWSELPGGSLLITGGNPAVREVVKIDTLREYAVSSQPPMHTPRYNHAALYHSQYLYVLGGYNGSYLSECERYSCAESQWEVLPALPLACCDMSAVEVESSLYALGGSTPEVFIDTIQKLSLDSLTWKLMQLKLPQAAHCFPCFKTDTRVCLVIGDTLYSFSPLQVKAVRTVSEVNRCLSSYYSRGTLYYEYGKNIKRLALEL